MRRLAALFLGLMALTGPVLSAPIGVLVEERARVDYADISEEDRANILRNTAAGLLGLEPAASSL